MTRPSGGKRAGEKRRRERAEAEARAAAGDVDVFGAEFAAAQVPGDDATSALAEAMYHLRTAMRQAATDVAVAPSQRREQVGRLAAALAKVADPMVKIEELSHELREAHAALVRLKDRNAAQVAPRDPSGPAARPLQ